MKELLGRPMPPAPPGQKPARRVPKKRIFALCLAAVLLVAALVGVNTFAELNETSAVHVDPAAIEEATLAIGSHLVHLSALTDSVYAMAQSSLNESQQEQIYYKSELSGGAWFNITSATSLADITSAGTPVENSVIAALWFTHHTRSDGVTYDLLTGQPVGVFDTPNPYDLRSLEELMPLDLQHKLLAETQQDSEQGKKKIAMLEGFWQTQVRNAATGEADATLGHLQAYYQHLAANGATARQKDEVQKLQASIDALRRFEVMQILEIELQRLSVDASSYTDPEPVESGEEDEGEPAAVDSALVAAINESLTNVTASKAVHSGAMMAQGATLTSRLYYTYASSLINSASVADFGTCDAHLGNIIALSNIMDDVVEDAEDEAALMMDSLLPPAMDQYATRLRQGVTAEYSTAAGAGEAAAVLTGIAAENTDALNGYRVELQYLVDAYCLRLPGSGALDYVAGLLIEGADLYTVIPNDAFREGARSSVDAYIDYLSGKQRELELAGGGSETDGLQSELDSTDEQRRSALDRGDLERAAQLEAEAASLRAQLDAELAALAAELNTLNARLVELSAQLENATGAGKTALENEIDALRAQIAALAKSAPSGSLLELLQRLKEESKTIINNTAATAADLAGLRANIDTIIGMLDMEPVAVYAALQELLASLELGRELRGDMALNDAVKAVEGALAQNEAGYLAALSGAFSAEDMEDTFAAFFAGELAGPEGSALAGGGSAAALTGHEQEAAQLLAAHMVAEATGDAMVRAWVTTNAQRNVLAGNPLVYEVPRSASEEYVPALGVSSLCGMRYVWNGNASRVTLSRGGSYYVFRGYTNAVERSEAQGGAATMPHPAVVQNGLFIPSAYAEEELGVWAVYFAADGANPRCGTAVNQTLYAAAEALYTALMG